MAIHTPLRPYIGASSAARVSRTPQMLRKFMVHGMIVSAAPTKTPYATMEAANIGSANASMRRAMAPRSLTSATGVIMPMICGARMYINIPVVPITSIPIIMVILPKLSVGDNLYAVPWELVLTGCTIVTIPLIIIFLMFQDKFLASVTLGAVKG